MVVSHKIVVFGHVAAEGRMRELVRRIAVGQCDVRMFPISEDASTWRDSGVLSAIDACDVAVFAFCKEANASAAVSADARRYAVTPCHLLRGLLGVVGEAQDSPGFDYCGGTGNAKAILEKMRYAGGFGLLTGAVLCEEDQTPTVRKRRVCNAAGVVGYEDAICMLFVRMEAVSESAEFDVADEAMNLWRTVGLVAKAADEKWGGNGR